MEGQEPEKKVLTRKFKSRKWPWILLGILLLVVAAMLLAPVYLSSDSFKQMLQTKVARSTGGKLSIGDLSVGWLKGVKVSDLSFSEKSGWAKVSVQKIDTQPRIVSLLGGTLALGRTVIDQPRVEIDLRKRPASAATPQSNPSQAAGFTLLGDLTVNKGQVTLTSQQGQTVQIEDINSTVNLRAPGQTSSVDANMVVSDGTEQAKINATANVTPSHWTLKGTSGDVAVEVNDLNLGSLAPILELAGVDLQTQGRLTANLQGTLQDGQIQDVNAAVTGRNLDISGGPLKGDRLQTSQLNATAKLTQEGQTIRVDDLEAKTDWATLSASGTVPKTVGSLAELLQSGSDYRLQGQFDCNLPPLLSQMPNTFGLKPGMQITSGTATGTIDTTTSQGRASLAAQAQIVNLAGQINGKPLALSEPVKANVRVSANGQTTRLDTLDVSAAFATVSASGDFKQIAYDANVNLAQFQAELGQFANLGPYNMAGNLSTTGKLSIATDRITDTGTALAKELVLTSADGNSVSEPSATVEYTLALDQASNLLSVNAVQARGSFGKVTVTDLSIPLGKTSSQAMAAEITVENLDLAKAKPYAVLFASFPQTTGLAGTVNSKLDVTRREGTYRVRTDATQMRNFRLTSPGKEPFTQTSMTVTCDAQLDPSDKSIDVQSLLVESPQIKVTKGQFRRTPSGENNRVEGSLEGEADWAAVGQMASMFMPEGLQLSGRRPFSVTFASTYPANEPNALMANLNGSASTGFDDAAYMGLNVGTTSLDVRIQNGLMQVEPFTTTANNGTIKFAAQANFRDQTPLLQTPQSTFAAQNIQINREMTSKLLQYVNPLFANLTGVSGIANFECQKLAIPLAAGMEDKTEVVGTISASDIVVEASGLLSQILTAVGGQTSGDQLTIRPTQIALQDGVIRYDNMEIDLGENPIIFSGAIGLDESLNMTITLPLTTAGRTIRIGQPQQGQAIEVPLKGTLGRPELNLNQLLQNQLQDQLLRGLDRLLGG